MRGLYSTIGESRSVEAGYEHLLMGIHGRRIDARRRSDGVRQLQGWKTDPSSNWVGDVVYLICRFQIISQKENTMSYKVLFILNAAVALAFGLALLFVPATVLGLFGVTENYVSTLLVARFFGTAMFALGLVLWFAKDASDEAVQKNLGAALLISSVIGLVVTIIGMTGSRAVIRSNGWIAVLIYVLFALGYGFMLFLKPRMKEE